MTWGLLLLIISFSELCELFLTVCFVTWIKNINKFKNLSYDAVVLSHFSRVQLYEILCTVACQAPLPIKFSRQKYEWLAMPSSRGSSPPRDQTHVSCGLCFIGRVSTSEPLGKPLSYDTLPPFTETNLTETLKVTGLC